MDLLKNILNSYNLKDIEEQKKCSTFLFNKYGVQIKFNKNLLIVKYQRWSHHFNIDSELLPYCRGTILDLETLEPVSYTFKMRKEYEVFHREIPFNKVNIYKYYDGTMVNLYFNNHTDEWSYATKGRLDANNSKWFSDKSFQDLFLEVSAIDYSKLNKTYCYSFVLQHKENKIVSNIFENRVILVLVRDLTNLQLVVPNKEIGTNIILAETLGHFNSYQELETYVSNLDFNEAGVILTVTDKDSEIRSRLMSPDYMIASQLRGNSPSKEKLVIELNQTQLENYLYYYPEDTKLVNNLEIVTRRLVSSIFYLYQQVKVKKIYTDIPSHLRKIIYMIHQLYEQRLTKSTPNLAKISHQVVKGYFYSLTTDYKLDLLNKHKSYLKTEKNSTN